jgi:hypothetical protein
MSGGGEMKKLVGLTFGIAVVGSTLAWIGFQRVSVEGKFATSDVIVRNGKTYAPISDIAKAMGMVVVKTSGGYDLVRPGGANMVQGLRGKIGQELFNGKYRFTVLEVVRTSAYKPRFYNPGYDITPSAPSNEILAIICRLKNGTKEPVTIDLLMGANTAVTDMKEQSYAPDMGAGTDLASRGPKVLPGAAVDFALTFEIPKSAELKDLVFTVNDLTAKPNPDFRVSLKSD